jgi:GGDEF domain-containing protein
MDLISLKRYLDLPYGDGERSNAYQGMLELLAATVTEHPIDIDHAECDRFKSEVAGIRGRFSRDASSEQFSLAVSAISTALERHHRAVNSLARRQGSELQNMVAMLTQTIKSMGAGSEHSASNLEMIAGQLKRASALEDIYQLRLRLGDCLKNLRDEATRQRNENQGSVQKLKQELAASQQRLANHGIETDVDRVTGFAGRSAAEVAIHEAAEEPEQHYVVVAVLGKMQSINARFGYAVGDEVLCDFAARVAGRLCSRAAFYRWSGPAVIGILRRAETINAIRAEVARVAEDPITKSLVNGEQNAFLTTSAVSMVLPVAPPAGEIIARIDNFVAAQIPKQHCEAEVSV